MAEIGVYIPAQVFLCHPLRQVDPSSNLYSTAPFLAFGSFLQLDAGTAVYVISGLSMFCVLLYRFPRLPISLYLSMVERLSFIR